MNFKFTALVSFVCAFLFCFSMSQNALACSCVAPAPGVSQKTLAIGAREGSSAVLTAEVIEISSIDSQYNQVKLKVTKVWKGKQDSEVIVKTARDGAMCGYAFEKGKSYLLYANEEGGKLSVNNCSRTTGIESTQAKKDIKVLKKFKKIS